MRRQVCVDTHTYTHTYIHTGNYSNPRCTCLLIVINMRPSLHKRPIHHIYSNFFLKISFSSIIYDNYNGIFLIFIPVTLQKLWVPGRNRSEILNFEKIAILRKLRLLRTTLRKSCGRINVRCERSAGSVRGFAIREN